MDISKLPKFSQTPPPPPADEMEPQPVPPEAGFPVIPVPAIPAATSAHPSWCRKCHAPNAPNSRFCASCGAGIGGETGARAVEVGAEAWIGIAIGALLLFMNPTFIKYLFAPKPYFPFMDQTVNYVDSINFWSDLTITAFAFVLIIDGIVVFFARKLPVVFAAFFLTVLATIGNLVYFAMTYSQYGLALYQAIAVAFGVYISLYQWRMIQQLRTPTL